MKSRLKQVQIFTLITLLCLVLLSCNNEDKEPFKRYTSLVSQTGESIPTESILQNEISLSIEWTRLSAGVFEGKLSKAMSLDKTTISLQAQEVDRILTGGFKDSQTIQINLCNRYNIYDAEDNFNDMVLEIKKFN